MSSPDLRQLRAGFDHDALGSQTVFRLALQALSYPGRPIDMPLVANTPAQGHPAAAQLLLALLDADTRLWVSPSLVDSEATAWLRFHTGCELTADFTHAHFCWFALNDPVPPLAALAQGSDASPEQSASCIVEVSSLVDKTGGTWCLHGPGIQGRQHLTVTGLPPDFATQWQTNTAQFPRGVDVFLASPEQIVGMPRTTQMQITAGD